MSHCSRLLPLPGSLMIEIDCPIGTPSSRAHLWALEDPTSEALGLVVIEAAQTKHFLRNGGIGQL